MALSMAMQLFAGVALFLYGMKIMSEGLEKAAGAGLRNMLNMLTRNRFVGVLVGTLFTMIVQSSSATTVMVVSFVNAGLLTLVQSVSVIFGANIGTTITAQLIAFKLTAVAPLFLSCGVVMVMFLKKESIQKIGLVFLGFGMLFFGMTVMGDSMAPLREKPELAKALVSFDNPFLAVLIGAGVTCLIHSSSASIGLLQVMALQLDVPLETSVYVLLGCNIGTCIDAILASLGANKNAKRAALIHLVFNVFDATLLLILLQFLPITQWVRAISAMISPEGNAALEIANAHTLFKIVGVAIFLPISNLLVTFVTRILPGEDGYQDELHLKFLNESIMHTPPAAVHQAVQETARMGKIAVISLRASMDALLDKDSAQVANVERNEKVINFLNHSITRYLIRINQLDLSAADFNLIGALFHIVNDIERIGDHAENMAEFATQRIESDVPFTQQAIDSIREMLVPVERIVNTSIHLILKPNENELPFVRTLEDSIDEMERRLQKEHVERLAAGLCTPAASMIYADVLSNLERVADHAQNIAIFVTEKEPTITVKTTED